MSFCSLLSILAPAKNLCTLFKAVLFLIYPSNFDLIPSCLINSFRALGIIVSHMYNTHPVAKGCVNLPNLASIRIGFNHNVK